MSGHFVIWDLKQAHGTELNRVFAGNITHMTVNAAPHVWNSETQAEIQRIMAGGAAANRDLLPSHNYFRIATPSAEQKRAAKLSGSLESFFDKLVRPTMGLTGLCPAATAQWALGNKEAAFFEQAEHSAATLEYYYAAGSHV